MRAKGAGSGGEWGGLPDRVRPSSVTEEALEADRSLYPASPIRRGLFVLLLVRVLHGLPFFSMSSVRTADVGDPVGGGSGAGCETELVVGSGSGAGWRTGTSQLSDFQADLDAGAEICSALSGDNLASMLSLRMTSCSRASTFRRSNRTSSACSSPSANSPFADTEEPGSISDADSCSFSK